MSKRQHQSRGDFPKKRMWKDLLICLDRSQKQEHFYIPGSSPYMLCTLLWSFFLVLFWTVCCHWFCWWRQCHRSL